ncbi:MAG: T9SS type A sorting domain-containing protein [Candidatus Electryonea clarkiae]|nr:T9SS type A sorting domain-containing protein [Candidatus Electryonea clarkiae]MDP8286851.1 T9SS type A sorting domain-containing protein [Candidatus Electryonea clarkiae]
MSAGFRFQMSVIMVLVINVTVMSIGRVEYTRKNHTEARTIRVPNQNKIQNINELPGSHTESELDEILYEQDWEDGVAGWERLDGFTAEATHWQIDDFNSSINNGGDNWRCFSTPAAFGENGGYESGWLQFLQTANIDLREIEQAVLQFDFYLVSERGSGWDGANVWIKADGGNVFEALIPETGPDYNGTDIAGFSEVNMMNYITGGEIPGWSGNTRFDEWQTVTMDLSEYNYQDVSIMFAFAADYEIDTRDDEDYTGFQVDNIIVVADADTVYYNDADDEEDEMIAISGYPSAEHTFTLTEVDSAHSGSHALATFEPQRRVSHFWQSPEIQLPWITDNETLRFDCWLRGEFEWENGNDEFRFNLFVKPNDSGLWYFGSQPYGEGTRAFYTGEPGADWVRQSDAWSDFMWDATPYAGQRVTLRFAVILPADTALSFTNFEMDDFFIHGSGLEHDIAISNLVVPFPTSVNFPVNGNVTFTNVGWDIETGWNAFWRVGNEIKAFIPSPPYELDSDESITLSFDSYPDDQRVVWIPEDEGEVVLTAWHTLDSDLRNENDSLHTIVDISPSGVFEFGYDNRFPQYLIPIYEPGTGPLMHVIPEEHSTAFEDIPLNMTTVRMYYYKDPNDFWTSNPEIELHFFQGGEIPGTEIYVDTFEVDWVNGDANLKWLEMDVTGAENLQMLEGDFYVWAKFLSLNEEGFPVPYPLAAEQQVGEGHHFLFDGTTSTPATLDYMIRVIAEEYDKVAEISDNYSLPSETGLLPAFPNPFNSSVMIHYQVRQPDNVNISIFDLLGRKITKLAESYHKHGKYQVHWEPVSGVSSGSYFIIMESGDINQVKRINLLK